MESIFNIALTAIGFAQLPNGWGNDVAAGGIAIGAFCICFTLKSAWMRGLIGVCGLGLAVALIVAPQTAPRSQTVPQATLTLAVPKRPLVLAEPKASPPAEPSCMAIIMRSKGNGFFEDNMVKGGGVYIDTAGDVHVTGNSVSTGNC